MMILALPSERTSRTRVTALLLGLGSLCLFLAGISRPPFTIFDEPKYVGPANSLLLGIHDPSPDGPPLGKLILAASIKVFGFTPTGWRMPSAIFGALTLVGVYLLAELLLEDYALALGAAAFTVLNNFLYVFSRTAMMDIFLMAFAVWGMIFFVAALKWKPATPNTRRGLLVASGALIGMACASKWNGVDELCVAVLIVAVVLLSPAVWKNMEVAEYQANLRAAGIVWIAASYLLIPFVIYFATYWPYCRMLGVPYTASTVRAMNVYIWRFHLAVIGNPPIITRWYTWPLSTQPMRALSYLVLNWYVMVVGLAAGIYCLKRFAQNLPETLIVLLYAANLLQWAVTPQKCLYYYYYFPAATFLGLAIPIALYRLPPRFFGVRLRLFSVLPAFLVFAYCFGRTSNLLSPYDCILGCWP